jgi:YVTN family beta-propeller protein
MRRRITSQLLTSYLATVALALAAPAAHADRPGWLALHSPWRHSLSSRLFTATPNFGPAAAWPPTTPVGNAPAFAAEDYSTQTLYVPNSNDNTVSVVSLATCTSGNLSGCARPSPTIGVGTLPLGVAVDEATDTVYVANALDGTVSVIDGATCNATDSSGCGQKPATVSVGAFGDAVAVDPVTNTVFVTNQDTRPGTVSVIDGNSCNGTHPSGCAGQPFVTVSVGGGPSGIDFDPKTNTIYVANGPLDSNGNPVPHGNTLSVINGATCHPSDKAGCAPVGTVRVGPAPAAVAVDPGTDTVYVANTHDGTLTKGPGTVSVVDGSRCNGTDPSGCASQAERHVTVGQDPIGVAVDPNNHSVYVSNANDDTVSIINANSCNRVQISGCNTRPPTIALGSAPSWPVVDPARHTVYVVDQVDNNVAVLSDQTCDAETSSGCRHPAQTMPAGSYPDAAATDQRFHTVYIGDAHGNQPPYTVSMIDAATCNAADQSGCQGRPRALPADGAPSNIAVNESTNTVYVATGGSGEFTLPTGPLEVIDAATCNATATAGCKHTARVPAGGVAVAVDPATDTIYAANIQPDGSGFVSVINGRDCNAADTSGCAAQTANNTPTVRVGPCPGVIALDPATRTLYVNNRCDHTVSVVDTRHCHAGDTTGCPTQPLPTVSIPAIPGTGGPIAIAVDDSTHTAYVTDTGDTFYPGAISMIDTTHCHAGDTTSCADQKPATIPAPQAAQSTIRIDPQTHYVYVANLSDSSVSIIDDRHCNATNTSGCKDIPKIEVGSNPSDLTLDQANHTAYVPNFFDNTASVFGMFGPSGR